MNFNNENPENQPLQESNENQIEEDHPMVVIQALPTAAQSQNSFKGDKQTSTIPFINIIGVSYLIMGVNLVLFGLFLFLKMDEDIKWAYSFISIPFYIFLVSFGVCMSKILSHHSLNYNELGRNVTLFTLVSNALLCGVFILIMMLKLDNVVNWDYTIAFIPMYIGLAIALFYICFIFPGLIDKDMKLYNEAFLVLLYFFGILVWIIMLHLKLDRFINWYSYKVFLVLFVVLGTHILLTIKNIFENENFLRSFQHFVFVLLITLCLIIIVLKMDGMIEKSWSISCLPMFLLSTVIYGIEFQTIFEKFRN